MTEHDWILLYWVTGYVVLAFLTIPLTAFFSAMVDETDDPNTSPHVWMIIFWPITWLLMVICLIIRFCEGREPAWTLAALYKFFYNKFRKAAK